MGNGDLVTQDKPILVSPPLLLAPSEAQPRLWSICLISDAQFLSSPGFQGMPSAIRQSGPRPALRHLAPTGNAPASRGLPTTAQRVGEQTGLEKRGLGRRESG